MERKITCVDCGAEFVLTDDEVKWYEGKGFTLPKRCPDCRKQRKANKKVNK